MVEEKIRDTANFNELCRYVAENIDWLQETQEFKELMSKPFLKDIIDYYKDSELVYISDDGMSFSFSFRIPMPK